jgi:hypothetical protein
LENLLCGRGDLARGVRPGYADSVDRDEMLLALGAFSDEGVEYVLIGAAAMGIHGIVRATEDLDLFVRGTPENVERLQRALRKVYGNDPNIDQISAQDLLGEYPAVRYYPPTGDLYFDVMTRLGTAASYDTVEVEEKDIAGVHVRVASPRALYLLKRDTVRAIDRQDATALARAFKLDETP